MWNDESNQQFVPMCNPKYENQLPMVSFFEPPLVKINPYTKQPNPAKDHKYEGRASLKDFESFAKKYIPVYRTAIKTEDELEEFLSNQQLNKVLLFTNKKDTSILYKGLTAHYKDRLLFGEVSNKAEELIAKYKVEKFPTLMVLQTKENEKEPTITIYNQELQFKVIVEFLKQFATEKKVTKEYEAPESQKEDESEDEDEETNSQQKSQSEKNKKVKETVKLQDLDLEKYKSEIISSEEMPILIHVYTSEDNQHPHWEELTKKYGKLFIYYKLLVNDQSKKDFVEKEMNIKQFPSIKFLPVGTTKKAHSRISFNLGDSLEDINSEIDELIIDNTMSVNEQSLQIKLSQSLQDAKVLLILFHDQEQISLTYRVFSNLEKYKQKFEFLNMKDPSQQIKSQFQITNLPKLVAIFRDVPEEQKLEQIKPEEIKAAPYGGKFNYNDLSRFLNSWLEEPKNVKSKKKLIKVESQKQLTDICTKKAKSCFIALLNGAEQNNTDNQEIADKFQEQINILEQVKDKFGDRPISFGWIDGICQTQVLQALQMSDLDLPNFIYYSESKQSFGKIIGRFEYETLALFVHNSLKNTIAMNPLNFTELQIQNVNCEETHQKYLSRQVETDQNKSEEDDEILKEILEEERIKKEQLKKEFKPEKKNKKKSRKSKKSAEHKEKTQTDL
eukprot:TRINITY_DN5111_c0_g2_i5.p1 TRINITY_DN5111_c0_g2~~TRINITY_DN5111_c0_g2_i5.p1  ORF type:complete len:672 (-),score=172.46 TRINITY_DN5111_c0_g2_i5:332-2347(-)